MGMPPGILAQALTLANPEFVMAGSAALQQQLLALAQPLSSFSALVQWLQANPAASSTISQALNPGSSPSSTAVPLPSALLDALSAVWIDLEALAFNSDDFRDYCWSVQEGVIPAKEPVSPNDGSWTLAPFAPHGLVALPSIAYDTSGQFSLQLQNNAPRHLGAYATFLNDGTVVTPKGWISQLPSDVPAAFESEVTKFLAFVLPNLPVSAIDTGVDTQSLAFTLPANADSALVTFGGVGATAFSALACAAGVMLTYFLDYTAAWIASRFPNADPGAVETWFQGLLNDTAIRDAVVSSGTFLLPPARLLDMPSVLDALAAKATEIFLSAGLQPLRDSIDAQFGKKKDPVTPSQMFAATVGWSAEIVAALLRRTPPTQSWAMQVNAASPLELAPATSAALEVAVTPDARYVTFPFAMSKVAVEVGYGDGAGAFTQSQTVAMPAPTDTLSIPVTFGSLRNAGVFDIGVTLTDASGSELAAGSLQLVDNSTPAGNRNRVATVAVREPVGVIGKNTQFVLNRTLNYSAGAYVWAAGGGVVISGSNLTPACLTVQENAQSLGYVWNAPGQSIANCAGGGPIPSPYLLQNVGTMVADAQLMTSSCGFVQQPALVYGAASPMPALGAMPGFWLDPRGSVPYLRDIAFGRGPFVFDSTLCRAQLSGNPLDAIAIHPAGYAVAVSAVNNRLEIVELSARPVPEAAAPAPLLIGGAGTRAGLLESPVAVAVTPAGFVLVLEQGNARLQAFDVHGNSALLFDGSAFIALTETAGTTYLDLAVSASGYLFVLSSDATGISSIDVYTSNGAWICRASGLNASRIAVDARNTLYTLNNTAIVGRTGQPEPSLSAWTPSGV